MNGMPDGVPFLTPLRRKGFDICEAANRRHKRDVGRTPPTGISIIDTDKYSCLPFDVQVWDLSAHASIAPVMPFFTEVGVSPVNFSWKPE